MHFNDSLAIENQKNFYYFTFSQKLGLLTIEIYNFNEEIAIAYSKIAF